MSDLGLIFYAVVAFVMSILSGATGGGGGFILTPLMIFLGLSPAQAVANGKFGGLSVTVGSLAGLRGHKVSNRRLVILLALIAFVIGLIAPKIIVEIDAEIYEKILGVLMIFLSPLIVYKKVGHATKKLSKKHEALGFLLIITSMFLVGIFSGGVGIFINIAMMGFLGMSSLDASVTKRFSQLVLNATIIIGLIGSGLFLWKVILVNVVVNGFGGYVGGKVALKRGAGFVSTLIAITAFLSGIALLVM